MRNYPASEATIASESCIGTDPLSFGAGPTRIRTLRFRHHDSCSPTRAGLLADYYFYVAIERVEEMHSALLGKTIQAIIHQGGNLGLIDFEDGTPHSAADRPAAHLSKNAKGGAPTFSSLPTVKNIRNSLAVNVSESQNPTRCTGRTP
jgi:hypothetical protein